MGGARWKIATENVGRAWHEAGFKRAGRSGRIFFRAGRNLD
jgi:hypothetical protein